jgi:hypothetical protein
MGVDINIYVGAWASVAHKIVNEGQLTTECVNKKCKCFGRQTKSKFCSECGDQIRVVETTVTKEKSAYDELMKMEEFEGRLYVVDSCGESIVKHTDILAPNRKLEGCFHIDETGYGSVTLLDTHLAEKAIELFKTKYSKELKFLESKGFEPKFGYGVAVGYS